MFLIKLVVLDGYTTNPGDLSWDLLEAFGQLEVYNWTEPSEVVPRAKGATAIFSNKVPIDAAIMDELPDLKYIGIIATGLDVIDLKAARERNITVTNVPVYANYSVAQLTFALILELCYRTDLHHRSITVDRHWSNQSYNSYWLKPLVGLEDKTLGVIGMGKIGERVAAIGTAFEMKVLAYDVIHRELPNVTWVGLNEILKRSDIISIHCPLLPTTRGMINKDTLKIMKSTAFLVNTSRGPLVVEKDLADALNKGVIAGAGLDVLEKEPPASDNPLLDAKNVVLTPHIGWATLDARRRLISTVADNLRAFLNGAAINVVD